MSEQMQMIIILFIFAFLAGFFIIHLLRKNAYKKKYEEKIAMLEDEDKKAAHLYTQTLEKKQKIQSEYNDINKQYETDKEYLNTLSIQEEDILQQISSLENKKDLFKEKIKLTDQKILEIKDETIHLSSELKDLETLRDIIALNEEKISSLENALTDKKQLIDAYRIDIDQLKEARKSLRLEAEELNDNLTNLKAKLFEINQTLQKIEQKYRNTIKALTEETKELKIRAINYEYAIKEYATLSGDEATKVTNKFVQKIFRMPSTKTKEIDSIVRKNDHTRWLDKLAKKLFKKSHIADEEI
jgi:chromosome segregation ATPase